MNGLSPFPRIGESLVGRGADIRRDQRVHGLRSYICRRLARSSNLCHLRVKDSLLERINLKSCQNINLLNQQRWSILLSQFLSYLGQNPSRISVLIGFPKEFYSFHFLILLNQMVCISLQKLLDLQEVVLLS